MKIVVNALASKQGGGQTYIINYLRFASPDIEYVFLVGEFNRAKFENELQGKSNISFYILPQKYKSAIRRTLWEMFSLPKLLKKLKADVYFAVNGPTPTRVPSGCRSVTSIRNMLLFDPKGLHYFSFLSPAWFRLLGQRLSIVRELKRYDKVVCISKCSYEAALAAYPGMAEKSRVIYHGLNDSFHDPNKGDYDFAALGLKRGEFYLYLSVVDFYKAQLEVTREWKTLVDKYDFKYPLVLAGFLTREKYVRQVRELIKELHLEDKVLLPGAIDYARLPAFLDGARAMVFASACECCPNILLEKLSAGKPIFCSDIPPMPEFGGPDAYYFDPYRPGELSRAVIEAERDPEEMRRRGEKLAERAEEFNWRKTIRETERFITE